MPRSGQIPGVTGKRVPGSARLPPGSRTGGLPTGVPRQPTSGEFSERHRQQMRNAGGRFAGGWGAVWVGVDSTANALEDWNDRLHQNVVDAVEDLKDRMVDYAKETAPWNDRTAEVRAADSRTTDPSAREGLHGGVVWEDADHFTIWLGHADNVFYGIFLEVRFGGRDAVLVPTMKEFEPLLGDALRGMV